MEKQWTIKMIYNNGGHLYREGDRVPLYPSKQHAAAACEVLNAVNRNQKEFYYIPVESEV